MYKKKILILSNNDMGLYKFRKELVKNLLDERFEVYISVPYGKFIEKFEEMGCYLTNIKLIARGKNFLEDTKLLYQYYKLIKNIHPDVVLTYTIKPNIYGSIISSLLKIPYIVNITGLGSAVENRGILQKITITLYKIALKRVTCVFFQNKENQEFFLKNSIHVNKYQIIPGSGVNIEKYRLLDYPDDKINITFLYISRILKEKGIEEYLYAAKQIKTKYCNTIFHVLGYCEEEYIDLIDKYCEDGYIIYHGMQSDIIPFLEQSHCIIHPTYYPEGMSNVLLESASCGRPAITTNRSGCYEIVDDGKTGFLIEEKDINMLIKKIELFISLENNKRKEMGINARNKMIREFNRIVVINAYMEEIYGICSKS
jgi:galacturonosyltransferase